MINPSRITRSARLRIKLQSIKIGVHQIVKKSEIAKNESALSPYEKLLWNIVFFEKAPRRLLIFVLKDAKVI